MISFHGFLPSFFPSFRPSFLPSLLTFFFPWFYHSFLYFFLSLASFLGYLPSYLDFLPSFLHPFLLSFCSVFSINFCFLFSKLFRSNLLFALPYLFSGTIGAISDGEGLGSTFFIQLPLYTRSTIPPPIESNRQQKIVFNSKRSHERVLTKSKNSVRAPESSGRVSYPSMSSVKDKIFKGNDSNDFSRSTGPVMTVRKAYPSSQNILQSRCNRNTDLTLGSGIGNGIGLGERRYEGVDERGGGRGRDENFNDEYDEKGNAKVSAAQLPTWRNDIFGSLRREKERDRDRERERGRENDRERNRFVEMGHDKADMEQREEDSELILSAQAHLLGQRFQFNEYVHQDVHHYFSKIFNFLLLFSLIHSFLYYFFSSLFTYFFILLLYYVISYYIMLHYIILYCITLYCNVL